MIYLILVLIIVVISVFLVFCVKKNAKLKDQNKKLSDNLKSVLKYSELITELKQKENSINLKIMEAKTDEEIINIISELLTSNNNRVRK